MMRSHNDWLHRDHTMVQLHNKQGRLRDWVKLGLATALESTGLASGYRFLRTLRGGARIHVLGYHRVVDAIDWDGPVNPSLCITTDAFRRQMEQLRRRFVVLPLGWAARALRGDIDLPHDAACVTFDDGYRDVIVRAHNILRELDIPATVFVPTGFDTSGGVARLLPHDRLYAALWAARRQRLALGRLGDADTALLFARAERALAADGPAAAVEALIRSASAAMLERAIAALEARLGPPPLDDGAAVLARDEVRQLADAGWEIGGHTVGHVVLTHEPLTEVRRQLRESKADLERWSGRPCRFFAYCNGYHSPTLVRELRRAGYEGAVTTCDRPNRVGGDPFRIARKVLWEAHARGPHGRFSPVLSAAHLHDTFGVLGLTAPVDGTMAHAADGRLHHHGHQIVQTHNERPHDEEDVVQTHNESEPTEVELAY